MDNVTFHYSCGFLIIKKDFIERTYASIVSDMSIAFSELVANSWDAGATLVSITLPSWESDLITIEDNGSGDRQGISAKVDDDFGEMYADTYRQLVRRAEKRLFNLKEKLTVRYQEMSVKDYLSEVLKEPRQTELAMAK